MQKIMFNDRYALTQAVIDGRKTMTRRIEGGDLFQEMAASADEICYNEQTGMLDMRCEGADIFSHKLRYKVGQVAAVAQSYYRIDAYPRACVSCPDIESKGWRNKMYVRPDFMPHRIRITNIRCERLQDISDEACIREGIKETKSDFNNNADYIFADFKLKLFFFDTARQAFAALIDKVSGRGTWARNPWVVVYEFELMR